jgi:hypothetical protein
MFKKLLSSIALCLALTGLAFGQGTAGPVAGGNSYTAINADFGIPGVSWSATGLTLNYSAGSIYMGPLAANQFAIAAGTLTLTNTENTCTIPLSASSSCNFVYFSGSGTALSSSTTFATAFASGTNPLYACGTTGGNITGCLSLTLVPKGTSVTASGAVTGTGSTVLATSPTLVTPILGVAAGTSLTLSATTSQLAVGTTNVDTLSFTAPASSRTITFPDPGAAANIAYGTLEDCGTSTSCASPTVKTTPIIINVGHPAFSASTTLAITGLGPFTSSTSFVCTANDPTHPAYATQINNVSSTAATITSGTSNSDTWNFVCTGY